MCYDYKYTFHFFLSSLFPKIFIEFLVFVKNCYRFWEIWVKKPGQIMLSENLQCSGGNAEKKETNKKSDGYKSYEDNLKQDDILESIEYTILGW